MIYCTSYDRLDEIAKLYKLWTKRDADWKKTLFNSYFVVAKDSDSGEIVGATQYILISDPFFARRFALVENVYVRPDYRRQGVGRMLMEFTEAQVQLFSCEFLKLTTRKTEGRKLYKSLGYEEGSSFYKRGLK